MTLPKKARPHTLRKYVVGVYIPYLMKYFYWGKGNDYTDDLNRAKLFVSGAECEAVIRDASKAMLLVNDPHIRKGAKFAVSKVFVTKTPMDFYGGSITELTLTKPNHYALLGAVVNNI